MPDVDSLSTQEREVMDLLSGEPHHVVVQTVLGHPDALATTDEINHFAPDYKQETVEGAIHDLVDTDILAAFERVEDRDEGLPVTFFGFTEHGIEVLGDFNYLNGAPVARAIHEKTSKSRRIKRHETAPRPSLPEVVRSVLDFEG